MLVTGEGCEATDLKIALEFLPADHVALASDWPHYDGTPDLLNGFRKASTGLDEDDVRMVATGTLERWFPKRPETLSRVGIGGERAAFGGSCECRAAAGEAGAATRAGPTGRWQSACAAEVPFQSRLQAPESLPRRLLPAAARRPQCLPGGTLAVR